MLTVPCKHIIQIGSRRLRFFTKLTAFLQNSLQAETMGFTWKHALGATLATTVTEKTSPASDARAIFTGVAHLHGVRKWRRSLRVRSAVIKTQRAPVNWRNMRIRRVLAPALPAAAIRPRSFPITSSTSSFSSTFEDQGYPDLGGHQSGN